MEKGNFKNSLLAVSWLLAIFFVQQVSAAENVIAGKDYSKRFMHAEQLALSSSKDNAEKAIDLWKSLLKDYPNDLAVSNNLAATLMKQKQYAEAQKYLESALNADPKIAVIMANLNDIYAYQAQLAYQSVFKPSEINYPQGKWVALASQGIKTPEKAQLEKVQKDMQRVLNRVENWRVSWASKDVKSYLHFYQKNYHSDKFHSHSDWVRSRENSLKRPKYIKIHLADVKIVPLANHTFQVSFVQNYQSNRFKDSVRKVLVWQLSDKNWQIIQEKVIYD